MIEKVIADTEYMKTTVVLNDVIVGINQVEKSSGREHYVVLNDLDLKALFDFVKQEGLLKN